MKLICHLINLIMLKWASNSPLIKTKKEDPGLGGQKIQEVMKDEDKAQTLMSALGPHIISVLWHFPDNMI